MIYMVYTPSKRLVGAFRDMPAAYRVARSCQGYVRTYDLAQLSGPPPALQTV